MDGRRPCTLEHFQKDTRFLPFVCWRATSLKLQSFTVPANSGQFETGYVGFTRCMVHMYPMHNCVHLDTMPYQKKKVEWPCKTLLCQGQQVVNSAWVTWRIHYAHIENGPQMFPGGLQVLFLTSLPLAKGLGFPWLGAGLSIGFSTFTRLQNTPADVDAVFLKDWLGVPQGPQGKWLQVCACPSSQSQGAHSLLLVPPSS